MKMELCHDQFDKVPPVPDRRRAPDHYRSGGELWQFATGDQDGHHDRSDDHPGASAAAIVVFDDHHDVSELT
jgi:hypothetical protein